MKRIVGFAAAVLFSAGLAFAAAPGTVKLPLPANPKQGVVTFPHEKHAAAKCDSCHAKAEGGKIEGLADQKKGHAMCQECHLKTAKEKARKELGACTNCHAAPAKK